MRSLRSYYSATIVEFLQQSSGEILGIIHSNSISAETTIQQSGTWESEVQILKGQLRSFADNRIIFEYTIPRMGKHVDALDLRNFHKESHNKLLVPIMISTQAPRYQNTLTVRDCIVEPIRCNASNIGLSIEHIANQFQEAPFDYVEWENSEYLPTPTIVEAAQALYRGHNVRDITRSDAGAENLTVTTDETNRIIEYSKANENKFRRKTAVSKKCLPCASHPCSSRYDYIYSSRKRL